MVSHRLEPQSELKREFIRRCLSLLLRNSTQQGNIVTADITDGYHRLVIRALDPEFFVDLFPGGRIYRSQTIDMLISAPEIYSQGAIEEIALPLMRKHMLLDDIAAV